MRLTSMTDYVLNPPELEELQSYNINFKQSLKYRQCEIYAKFLKQPLKLEMFLPCDEDGVPYPDLDNIKDAKNDSMQSAIEWKNFIEIGYPKAKEKVLFKGFRINKEVYQWQFYNKTKNTYLFDYYPNDNQFETLHFFRAKRIEDLTKLDLELTKTAIKQLGL